MVLGLEGVVGFIELGTAAPRISFERQGQKETYESETTTLCDSMRIVSGVDCEPLRRTTKCSFEFSHHPFETAYLLLEPARLSLFEDVVQLVVLLLKALDSLGQGGGYTAGT